MQLYSNQLCWYCHSNKVINKKKQLLKQIKNTQYTVLFRLLDILVLVPSSIISTNSHDTQIWLINSLDCYCISTFQVTWKVQYMTSYHYYGFLISFILVRNGACLASLTCFLSNTDLFILSHSNLWDDIILIILVHLHVSIYLHNLSIYLHMY